MRLFVAIDFPESVRDKIVQIVNPLTSQFPQVSWTKKENIHLTIKFLGNIKTKNIEHKTKNKSWEDELLEKIKNGIEQSIMGIKSFELVFEKIGFFEREQLIIWLGAETPSPLSLLVERLDRQMAKLGFPKERRMFTPHITLGRGKHLAKTVSQKIKEFILNKQVISLPPFLVKEVTLVSSTLVPAGPIYTPLAQFALTYKRYIIGDTS